MEGKIPVDAVEQGKREAEQKTQPAAGNAEAVGGAIPALSEQQLTAIAQLAKGVNITAVAAKVGVNRSTIHRWMQDPVFAAERERLKEEHYDQLTARALSIADEALEAVKDVMDTSYMPRDRLAAAKFLLKMVGAEGLK